LDAFPACSQTGLDSKQQLMTFNQFIYQLVRTSHQVDKQPIKNVPASFGVDKKLLTNKQIEHYKNFLKQQLYILIPNFEFFQTARDWQKCNATEFEVPPQELWNNIVPTLNILDQRQQQILMILQ
jgi:hypothetical protein